MFSAVILAAGEAERMGRLKQLLPWGESTILGTVVQRVCNCHYIDDEIRVVLGAGAEQVIQVLNKWDQSELRLLVNREYKKGLITSVWKGLEDLPFDTEFIIFVLGDQPLIPVNTFNLIIEEFLEKEPEIIVPVYRGRRGHPLIMKKGLLPEVYKLTGPGGLRSLVSKYPEKVYFFEVDDKRITIDLDYFEEYLKYKRDYDRDN